MNGFLTLSALTANALAILSLQPPHTLPMLPSDSPSLPPSLTLIHTHSFLSDLCFSHSASDLIRFSSVRNYLVVREENDTGRRRERARGKRETDSASRGRVTEREKGASRKESGEKKSGRIRVQGRDGRGRARRTRGRGSVRCVRNLQVLTVQVD